MYLFNQEKLEILIFQPRLDVVVKHLMLLSLLLTGLSGISGAVHLTFVWIDEGKGRGGVEWLRRR